VAMWTFGPGDDDRKRQGGGGTSYLNVAPRSRPMDLRVSLACPRQSTGDHAPAMPAAYRCHRDAQEAFVVGDPCSVTPDCSIPIQAVP